MFKTAKFFWSFTGANLHDKKCSIFNLMTSKARFTILEARAFSFCGCVCQDIYPLIFRHQCLTTSSH